ncbi:MAG: sulfite exporter TauE/SafE family protein, partial [Calditrichales bacterium]
AAVIGAVILVWFSDMTSLLSYQIFGHLYEIEPVKGIIGLLILGFLVLEWLPALKGMAIDKKYLPLGGALSGFFGGLSGHQGALRSMFLLKAGLNKESFIATGVVIASLVDISRLLVYSSKFERAFAEGYVSYLLTAIIFAFIGAFMGSRLLKKITMNFVQAVVSILLLVIGIGLISGII